MDLISRVPPLQIFDIFAVHEEDLLVNKCDGSRLIVFYGSREVQSCRYISSQKLRVVCDLILSYDINLVHRDTIEFPLSIVSVDLIHKLSCYLSRSVSLPIQSIYIFTDIHLTRIARAQPHIVLSCMSCMLRERLRFWRISRSQHCRWAATRSASIPPSRFPFFPP